jgi:hypothetical protein
MPLFFRKPLRNVKRQASDSETLRCDSRFGKKIAGLRKRTSSFWPEPALSLRAGLLDQSVCDTIQPIPKPKGKRVQSFLIIKFPSRSSTLDVLCMVVAITIANLLCGVLPLTAQDDCKELKKVTADALNKVHHTPTHVYTTTKINDQSFSSEIIYAAGSMYIKINGKWNLGGSIKEMEQSEQQLQHDANSKDTCRQLKDESINGEVASVYNSHSETPKGTIDMQFWISKANGELLRQDMSSSGEVMSSRYEYNGVKPPM